MSYFKTAIHGVFWTAGLRGLLRLLNFARTAVLARLLLPAQFGQFGIATMSLALLEILTETGINVFLLQEQSPISKYLDTAWIISIIRGFLIAVAIFLAAPFVSVFFAVPASLPLLYLSCLIPVFRGFINPACIRFQKDLHFNKEFAYRLAISAFEILATTYLAFATHSASALVLGLVLSSLFETLLSWMFISPRPHLSFSPAFAQKILHRGKWVTGFGLFEFLFTNTDNIVVGRLLGAPSLGIYQNAYKLSTVPLTEVTDIFYKVTFPLFTRMHSTGKNLRPAVLKTVLFTSSLMLLIGLLIYQFSSQLVIILLGPNWLEAIPVVRALAFLGVVRGLSYSFNSFFMAQHLQKYVAVITLVSVVGLSSTIIPLVRSYGLVGAAYSAMFGSLLSLPVALFIFYNKFKFHES